ncbi:hypothetical protein EON80_15460 [bacterium]|nr:MAG: hypothetical protein EON80_15460 [bacterium]
MIKFALSLANGKGTMPFASVDGMRIAGYSDRQIVESIGATSAILFTNMLNRANDTTLDFPRVKPVHAQVD